MNKIANFAPICKEFFTVTADRISIATGFIKRKRKVTGSSFVKALVIGNMGNEYCSIESMCQFLIEDSIEITKQGLDLRFTENAVNLMKEVYQEALNIFKKNIPIDCQILRQFNSVKLLDSSNVILPSSMESLYRGCNASYKDRSNKNKSAIKLQVVFDYLNQALDRLDITESIRADQGYRDHLQDIKKDDLLIADLGYFVPSSFKKISESGGYFISRYKTDTNIYDRETNQQLNLLRIIDNKLFFMREIFLGQKARLPVRIIGYKLTAEQSNMRRRKANLLAKGHGYKSSVQNQTLLNWSIFITNIPEDKISAKNICGMYRTRWQIELLFKLYKSHAGIERIKGRSKSSRILCELYAKLSSICIFHGITSCLELGCDDEISLTKAFIELKKRVRELFLSLNQPIDYLENFLRGLIFCWSKFCLKDKYRKKRISTLNMLKSMTTSTIEASMIA